MSSQVRKPSLVGVDGRVTLLTWKRACRIPLVRSVVNQVGITRARHLLLRGPFGDVEPVLLPRSNLNNSEKGNASMVKPFPKVRLRGNSGKEGIGMLRKESASTLSRRLSPHKTLWDLWNMSRPIQWTASKEEFFSKLPGSSLGGHRGKETRFSPREPCVTFWKGH
jgi:hypothetical protein